MRTTTLLLTTTLAVCAVIVVSTANISCLPKQGRIQAPASTTLTIVPAVSYPDRMDVDGVPDDLAAVLRDVAEARNLQVSMLDAGQFGAEFAAKRNTLHRLDWLAERHGDDDLLLLIEIQPRFFSLLSGRYRWTVEATLSLMPRGKLEETVTATAQFPVFMEFHHEREPAVLSAAAAILERHVGYLLDEVLGGL
jgi:hypothetical protein